MTRRTLARRALLAACVLALLSCTWCWQSTHFFDWWPARDGMEAAMVYAAARGFQAEGGFADFVPGPDRFGRYEVRVELTDGRGRVMTVRIRRAWRLADWEVLDATVRDP